MAGKRTNICPRFWSKVDASAGPNGCWIWTATTDRFGHGQACLPGRLKRGAHRVAWMLSYGEWPELCVLHRCDNPPCVNPAHLFLGTKLDNMRDMIAKGRDHHPVGEAAACVVLTTDKVLEIRRIHASGEMGFRRLAKKFGVHRATVASVVRRKTWRHV